MKTIKYKEYTKREMLEIIKKEGFLFVETSLGDNYIIKKVDLADFIILEAQRTGHIAEMKFYIPGIDEPVMSTFGWFLNKANPLLREEIIDRLVLLQTTNKNPRRIKVFNIHIFNRMTPEEMGINDGRVINFDKLYQKYVRTQNIHSIKTEGV